MHFQIYTTTIIYPVKWNKLSFPGIEINKPIAALVLSVLYIRFKFRGQL